MTLIVSLLLSCSTVSLLRAEIKTIIDYNFNESTKEGLVISHSFGVRGAHKKLDTDLLEDIPGKAGNRALRLTRRSGLEYVHVQHNTSIPENCDYEISLRCDRGEKGDFGIGFHDTNGQEIGALYFKENRLLAYNEKKKWTFSGIRLPENKYFTLKVEFYASKREYKIKVIDHNEQSKVSIPMPFLSQDAFQRISFNTCLPKGSSVLLDDLKVTYNSERIVENRVDALGGAEIFIRNNDGSLRSLPTLNDGIINENAISDNTPLELNINLEKPTEVSTIRLYDGDPRTGKFPSGSCRVLSYDIEGLNTAGQWRELVSRKTSEKALEDGTSESMYRQDDFEPISLSKLKITIYDSSDTLERSSGKIAKKKVVVLREIGLWGKKLLTQNQPNKLFRENIYGEFRLPVYQSQDVAGLHLYNDREDKENHQVKIELRGRYFNKLVQETRIVDLKHGENIIEFQLGKLPDGEYAVSVIDQSDLQKKGYKFRRLLRLQRLVYNKEHNITLANMTGKKMFFPDAHYLNKYSDITFHGAQAKLEQVVKPDSVQEGFIRHGYQVFLDKSGEMYLPFYTVDRFWDNKSRTKFIAIQSDEDKEQWIVSKMDPSYISRKVKQESPISSLPPEAAKPDWDIKYKNGGAPVFRFYDPQKDGKVNLNQVFIEATRRARGKHLDWGIINPPSASTWPVWYKAPGEAIVLTKTPLLQDKMSPGEFEAITDSNDNYVGQWLSDDGKTLSYARGRLLKRYPPFTAPYDNLSSCSRIISIISTEDGINWKYSYMVPPDKNDPPVAQHYGAQVFRVPYGNGLMQSFVYRYWARSQQISIELAYSWDGTNWHRFPGQPAFAENGEPGSWTSGSLMISSSAVARDGMVYQMLSWVCDGFHFYGDFYYNRSNIKEVTGEMLKKYFSGRDLESWPFFKYFEGYDGIATDIQKAGVSVGIASYRLDGLFFMSVEDNKTGSFVSRLITASNGMSANVSIDKEGFLAIDLLDKDDKMIPGYTTQLSSSDNINISIFENLPKSPFKVRAKLKNTKLYSLSF